MSHRLSSGCGDKSSGKLSILFELFDAKLRPGVPCVRDMRGRVPWLLGGRLSKDQTVTLPLLPEVTESKVETTRVLQKKARGEEAIHYRHAVRRRPV